MFELIKYYPFTTFPIPIKYSIDIYKGCSIGCLFCKAKSNDRIIFDLAIFKDKLEKDLLKLPSNTIIGMGGGLYEPFPKLNDDVDYSLEILNILDKNNMRVLIVTRSLDVLKYLKYFENFKHKPIILFSLFSLDEHVRNQWEKTTFSKDRLFHLINSFNSKKIPIYLLFSPIIKGINDGDESFLDVIQFVKDCSMEYLLCYFYEDSDNIYKKKKWKSFIEVLKETKIKPYMNIRDFETSMNIKDLSSFYFLYIYYLYGYNNQVKEGYRNLSYELDKIDLKIFEDHIKNNTLLSIKGVGSFTENIIEEDICNQYYEQLEKRESCFFDE